VAFRDTEGMGGAACRGMGGMGEGGGMGGMGGVACRGMGGMA